MLQGLLTPNYMRRYFFKRDCKRDLIALIFVIVTIILFNAIYLCATTKALVKFTCPICENKFESYVVLSTNNLGGQDSDFLSRARGDQPILLAPITCPICFYSGYRIDFDSDKKISKRVIEKIRNGKVLKPLVNISSTTKSYEIPGWVRYDLIAQTYKVLNKSKESIAEQFLAGSWAVRLETEPLEYLDKSTKNEIMKIISIGEERSRNGIFNPVEEKISLAEEFEKKSNETKGNISTNYALAALILFRAHGENTKVEHLLRVLESRMEKNKFKEFYEYVIDSINRERYFQQNAVTLIELIIEEKKQEEKAIFTYLCGELYRRLGNWNRARDFFNKALELKDPPEWLPDLIKKQKKLLP